MRKEQNTLHLRGALAFSLYFTDHLGGSAKTIDASRHTTIERRLQQYLLDLFLCTAIVQSATHMNPQFMRAIQCGEHANVDQTTHLPGKPWARPDRPPARLRHQLLQRTGEIIGIGKRFINVLISQYSTAYSHPLLKFFAIHFFLPFEYQSTAI